MTTIHYSGRVNAPPGPGGVEGASGSIYINVSDVPGGLMQGALRIGALPRMALTGFHGPNTQDPTFELSGENTRGRGLDQMHLRVVVVGTVAPDKKTIAGTVYAVLNGVDQPEWTFTTAIEGVDLPTSIGAFDTALAPTPPTGMLSRLWGKVPPGLKIVVGTGVAALGGLYTYRRIKG